MVARPKISSLIQKLQQDPQVARGYSWHNEEFHYKGHLYLTLKSMVLSEFHASPMGIVLPKLMNV
jgi:hypothetical protein